MRPFVVLALMAAAAGARADPKLTATTALVDPRALEAAGFKPASGSIVGLTVTGRLDRSLVRAAIQRDLSSGASSQLAFCYDRSPQGSAPLNVAAAFMISATGSIFPFRASGLGAKASACLGDALKKIRLPKPGRGEAAVSIQLAFKPAQLPTWDTPAPGPRVRPTP